jgi:DNA/RNA endonuclease YhcR with UshA esterase domain
MKLLGLILALAAIPAFAHHSFTAQYDSNKPVTVTGTVTKIEWTNPHARFYVDAKDASGTVTNWELELGSPNTLIRYGWKRDSMKVGESVTVEGYLARDGSKTANAKTVKFTDGRTVNAGSSSDLDTTK